MRRAAADAHWRGLRRRCLQGGRDAPHVFKQGLKREGGEGGGGLDASCAASAPPPCSRQASAPPAAHAAPAAMATPRTWRLPACATGAGALAAPGPMLLLPLCCACILCSLIIAGGQLAQQECAAAHGAGEVAVARHSHLFNDAWGREGWWAGGQVTHAGGAGCASSQASPMPTGDITAHHKGSLLTTHYSPYGVTTRHTGHRGMLLALLVEPCTLEPTCAASGGAAGHQADLLAVIELQHCIRGGAGSRGGGTRGRPSGSCTHRHTERRLAGLG